MILFDFSNLSRLLQFQNIGDPVMGGRSRSELAMVDGVLRFSGELSLANNGGFASSYIRGPFPNLEAYSRFQLRVMGDGRRYGFSIKSVISAPSVVHRHYFDTAAGEWIDLTIPIAEMAPRRRGQLLSPSVRVKKSRITEMGFINADKVEGPFELWVSRIEALK